MSVEPPEEPSFPLNYDVTVIILDKLPLHDVIRMRTVSRTMKNYIDEYFKTCIHVLAFFPIDRAARRRHKAYGHQLNRLSNMRQSMNLDMDSIVRHKVGIRWQLIKPDFASIITKFFPNIHELYVMNSAGVWPINELIISFPELKKLAIARNDCNRLYEYTKVCIENINNLKSLETLIVLNWNGEIVELFKKEFLRQLKHFYLPGMQFKSLDGMKVESIALHHNHIYHPNTIDCLVPEKYPNLKHVALPLSTETIRDPQLTIYYPRSTSFSTSQLLSGLIQLYESNKTIKSIQILDSFTDIRNFPSIFYLSNTYPYTTHKTIFTILDKFPELKTVQVTVNNKIGDFLWDFANYIPSFTRLEEICFNIETCKDLRVFDENFLRPLVMVSGGSVKKIVLQSISIDCQKAFRNHLQKWPFILYKIEIPPAKHCVELFSSDRRLISQ